MSEATQRDESEKQLIAEEAYRQWEASGRENGGDARYWLEAEASLQASGKIPRRPIVLPYEVTFTAVAVSELFSKSSFLTLLPKPLKTSPHRQVRLDGLLIGIAQFSDRPIEPDMLAHESRLLGIQVTNVIAAADRIARLIDWVSEQTILDPTLFETVIEEGLTVYRLMPSYRDALLSPDEHPDGVAKIDLAIQNHPFATGIAADVKRISLGSLAALVLEFHAMGWEKALIGSSLLSGSTFMVSFAGYYGKRLGEGKGWGKRDTMPDEGPTPDKGPTNDGPRKGVTGRVEPQAKKSEQEFTDAIEREQRAEQPPLAEGPQG